jgi:hypothetical protein
MPMTLTRVNIRSKINLTTQFGRPLNMAARIDTLTQRPSEHSPIGRVVVQYEQNDATTWIVRRSDNRGPTAGPTGDHVHLVHEKTGLGLMWPYRPGDGMQLSVYYMKFNYETPDLEGYGGYPDRTGLANFNMQFQELGNGFYAVKNSDGSMALDLAGGLTAAETAVNGWNSDGADKQCWNFITAYPPPKP